jgi:hypothetical protein
MLVKHVNCAFFTEQSKSNIGLWSVGRTQYLPASSNRTQKRREPIAFAFGPYETLAIEVFRNDHP